MTLFANFIGIGFYLHITKKIKRFQQTKIAFLHTWSIFIISDLEIAL